jgi:hypothetical protein
MDTVHPVGTLATLPWPTDAPATARSRAASAIIRLTAAASWVGLSHSIHGRPYTKRDGRYWPRVADPFAEAP